MVEQIEHHNKLRDFSDDFHNLRNEILLKNETENELPYDIQLEESMKKTINAINSSIHLQHIGGWNSETGKNKPVLGYNINLGNITIPRGTGMNVYNKTSGIKMDGGGAEFYIDHSQVIFDPIYITGNNISSKTREMIAGFAQQTGTAIDSGGISEVKVETIIKNLYGANHSSITTISGKEYLNRPQSLEEFVVKYTVKLTDGTEQAYTTRQYLTHKTPKPWTLGIYNTSVPGNEVGVITEGAKQEMIDYWDQLLDLMQQQAELNLLEKIGSQKKIIEKFFKPIIKFNDKQDVPFLEGEISRINNTIIVNEQNIIVPNDNRWNELVYQLTGCEGGALPKEMTLSFVNSLLSRYKVTENKVGYYQKSGNSKEVGNEISGNQFVDLWDGMGEFPDKESQFSVIVLREDNPVTLYQSESGKLYFGGVGGTTKSTDLKTGKTITKRKSMSLSDESIRKIVGEVYSQFICADAGVTREHLNNLKSLKERQGLLDVEPIKNIDGFFRELVGNSKFEKQFHETYDTQNNPTIRGEKGYVSRLKDGKGGAKLLINRGGKGFTLSQTSEGYKIEELGKTTVLGKTGPDGKILSGLLYIINEHIKEYSDEYDKSIKNRSHKN